MNHWGVRATTAQRLLGAGSKRLYNEMKRRPAACVLAPEQLLRISYLIGIFAALNTLHSRTVADRWIQLANTNPIFGGKTPLAYMVEGGPAAMRILRQLLDARCVG